MERRAASDPAFAAELAAMRPVVASLEGVPPEAWDVPEPPPLPALPPLRAQDTPARRWWRRPAASDAGARRAPAWRPAVALAAVALAVLVGGLSWWALAGRDDAGGDGPLLALGPVGTADPAARGEAHTARGGDALALSVSGLPESGPGAFYELWLLDGPERLLSLGSFRVPASGETSVEVPLPVPVTDFALIDVSREIEDGDPGHSGDSLLRGSSS